MTKPNLDPVTRYYIQDTRQYVGNCVLWWCPNRRGYTTQIDEAGTYSADEAELIAGMRGTDVPWPEDVVMAAVVRHVRIEHLRREADRIEQERSESNGK